MGGMGHAGGDDLFLSVVRYVPMVFVVAGVALVVWLSRQRMPYELRPDVLEALSPTEPLPPTKIRDRPPLAHQEVDLKVLIKVLEQMCSEGEVVRWYENNESGRYVVYRRVAESPPYVSPLR
jgi:hypothetical protein